MYRVVLCLLFCHHLCGQEPLQGSFIWKEGKAVAIQFIGLSDSLQSKMVVTLAGHKKPIFGRWQKSNQNWYFHPAIPFQHAQHYLLKIGDQVLKEFALPALQESLTSIVSVYPSRDTVPENLLKMHIQFSAPMGEGYSEKYVIVKDAMGDTLRNIFLSLQPELWNEAHDRLTLWLDPGRIKRGLTPNRVLGQPLQRGSSYSVDISSNWKDRNGVKLKQGTTKKLYATTAKRKSPHYQKWQVSTPSKGDYEPLIISFQEELDFVLASECISIWHNQKEVSGTVTLTDQESQWQFIPRDPWSIGAYSIVIEARLEDLAGNNLNHLFDRKIDQVESTPNEERYFLNFAID